MSSQPLNTSKNDGDLQRSLSNRHLQLIAIGGAIGTGLFMVLQDRPFSLFI